MPEVENRHGADCVEIGTHRREGGTLDRKLRHERVLDGRTVGVAPGVLGVEIEGTTLCERRHRHLDPVHRTCECLVVGLCRGRNVAGVERRELIHFYSPVFLLVACGHEREIMRSPH